MPAEHEAHTRGFYDHESDERGRRRRPVADWGVGEDVFDRLPSRRFTRADRRAEHHEASEGRRFERDAYAPPAPPRRRAERGPVDTWADEPISERLEDVSGDRRPVESWLAPEPVSRTIVIETSTPVLEEPAPRRTVVISGHPDRLAVVPRTSRPPRTAIDRIGASPDRIVGYAVALGFLLILIAALST
jgi:hypothetical protein